MSVYFENFGTEGFKSAGKGFEVGDFRCTSKPLKSIVIHNNQQPVQSLMHGKDQRFPHAAFVPFSIRRHANDSLILLPEFCGQCQSGSQWEAVSETAGGECDGAYSKGWWVTSKQSGVSVKRFEVSISEQALCPKADIQCPGPVPFGEDQLVAGLLHIVHQFEEQRQHREIAANVPYAGPEVHFKESEGSGFD